MFDFLFWTVKILFFIIENKLMKKLHVLFFYLPVLGANVSFNLLCSSFRKCYNGGNKLLDKRQNLRESNIS